VMGTVYLVKSLQGDGARESANPHRSSLK